MPLRTSLEAYNRKRNFERTKEPRGEKRARSGFSYVIQKHAARRLHYDFRLELDGVLLSWAVPKGPSLNPQVKRLAVQTEDHPVEYGSFEGIIPKGEYGGGTVMIWDRGTWEPEGDPRKAYEKGHLAFRLHGERLEGRWHLVRTRGHARGQSDDRPSWLLFKGTDDLASGDGDDLVEAETSSVVTKRTLDEIAKDRKSRVHVRQMRPVASIEGAKRAKAPATIAVEKATLVAEAPDGDEWLHEIKLDGYRVIALVRGGETQLMTRNGNDFTERAPRVAAELGELTDDQAIVDGEIVALRPDGVSDFQLLQNALSAGRADLCYYAFDLLYLDGFDLRAAPLEARKLALKDLLARTRRRHVRLSDHIVGQGPAFLEQACAAGAEGIVAKRRDSVYRGTRTRDWLKIKCLKRQELVIGGFTEPSGSRSGLGALLLGFWEDGSLHYAGKVGTGFTQRSLRDLRAKLAPLERDRSPFGNPPRGADCRGVHWVEPKCVAEVEYTELTGDRKFRHPTFRGLREDKPAEEIVLEQAVSPPGKPARSRAARSQTRSEAKAAGGSAAKVSGRSATRIAAGSAAKVSAGRAAKRASARPRRTPPATAKGPRPESPATSPRERAADFTLPTKLPAGFRLTHPERVLYPEVGITKRDLALYYAAVAPFMLPHVADRPLTVVRCPQGHTKACFFQKHAQKGQPKAIRIVPIEDEGGLADYTYIRDEEGLLSLAQMGVLEIHTWGAHVRDHERPDLLVFDLDPHEEVPWKQVVAAAELLRGLFEQLDLESFVKTTGGKGLHVCVPLQPRLGWDEIKSFCQSVAEAVVQSEPHRYVATMTKAKRTGKIFIDYLRNGRGATFISPYSTRARPGAPVAMPVEWDELARVRADAFTLKSVPEHLARRGRDPWEHLNEVKQALTLAPSRSRARKAREGSRAG